jgi:hypothetical protein
MASPDTAKPATARHGEPVSKAEWLGGPLDPSNTPNAGGPQAPPDDCGEDDETFFRRRPNVNTRTRLPIDGEFPPGVLEPGRGAFVRILIERDADGHLKRRARRVLHFVKRGTA